MKSETVVRYRVIGMDCADDAAEIEGATGGVEGVRSAHVSVASQVLTASVGDTRALPDLERAVRRVGYRLVPVDTHLAPAYVRALWIVVALNLGYGVMEMAAGFLAHSQALKADALDFLGDGVISLLAVLAIGWGARWRASAALIQGLFLGVLGLSVLGSTTYRMFVQQQPEAEKMGLFGFIALLVNVAAAVALLPHRTGDTNARSVWLFSRNDAIGNAAVVIAAGFVAWLDSPWPDLVAAIAIATLFLHSAGAIVRDARNDLATANDAG